MIINCKVKSIQSLASNTYQILLQPEKELLFRAGQYLLVVIGEKDRRPFSIASSPYREQGEIELHIGAAEHNAYALEVVDIMKTALKKGCDIVVDAPHGEAWLKEDTDRPLLLIAGGTGFSYIRSILDYCLSQNIQRQISLYWGARDRCQLYAYEELQKIEQTYKHVTFIPVVENSEDGWQGKEGNVVQAVCDDFESLADVDIYIAGRFEMAGIARQRFTQLKGAKSDRIFGDAYAFI
jgi:aquacobalamin reductase/NAD(P)H-flavin reductase